MAKKRELWELQSMQCAPLSVKIALTKQRIREWVDYYGLDGVYISFSGGKDSTVLLDIIRNKMGLSQIPAVFVDVPTQYPELRDFAKTFDNVEIIRPKINFMQVCEKYGFPIISKEVSECVSGARKYLTKVLEEESLDRQTDRQTDSTSLINTTTKNFVDKASTQKPTRGGTITSIANSMELESIPQRVAIMLGKYDQWYQTKKGNIPREDGNRSIFNQTKYKFFLDAPFEISNQCCNIMKKNPAHKYHKDTGRVPFVATMASESRLRTQKWLQNGCNGFDLKIPTSTPMSFWTEQDVLLYIKEHNLPICSVYGDIVFDYESTGNLEGQMTISDVAGFEDMGLFDAELPPLKTTGCNRTGCMLCGFGCHLEKSPNRFELLKETHPKIYNLLDVVKNNGVTFRQAIDWINEHSDLDIKY